MLVIIFGGFWAYQLNERISESLKNRKFLPPTEYWSAPESIFPRMNLSSNEFENLLIQRKYSFRPWNEKIRPGEYSKGNLDECQKTALEALPQDSENCFLFIAKETSDPEMNKLGLQMLVFGKDAKPNFSLFGNPLQKSLEAKLEPILIAQYLGKEPIQQNYTPLGEIPVTCLNSVLAIEDPKFLTHSGVSLTAVARAAVHYLTRGRVEGGSTITQQLVKNYFLSAERTFKRKIIELFMSLILEVHSSKDEILETYLNIIYLGQNGPFQVIGFPAAAEFYFGKPIQNLELHECALLAAVLNGPGVYDPFNKPTKAWSRRGLVLDKMVEHAFVRSEEAEQAKSQPLPARNSVNVSETAPYYIDVVQKELSAVSIPYAGKKVFTGLNLSAQVQAQKSVKEQLNKLETENKIITALRKKGKVLESVLLSADNKSGLIQAIVGGRSYRVTQFNRAIDSHRQVGSVMKPFVFLAALENAGTDGQKYNPMTILHDKRFTYDYQNQSWSPENYGKKYFGDVPMFFALKNSLNCATASLGIEVGISKIIAAARATGIESRLEEVPSVTLGSFELSPKEILQGYSTLANLGVKKNLHTVRSVISESKDTVYTSSTTSEQVVPAEPAAQLVDMMKQTILGGTARSAYLQGITTPAAGKTGTTSENKDSWFAGFTPYLTTIVWVGYDDNTSHGLTGASGALPVWISFMKERTAINPTDDFAWPESLIKMKVPRPEEEPKEAELLFIKGSEPKL